MSRRKRGFALLYGIAAVFVVAAAGVLTLGLAAGRIREVSDDVARARLHCLDDAAAAWTLAHLAADPDFAGTSRTAFGRGWFSSRVRRSAGGSWVVETEAHLESRVRRASLCVAPGDGAQGLRVTAWSRSY